MVEINYRHYDFIRKTLAGLDLPGTSVVHTNVKTFLRGCNEKYDIVFADPPYDLEWLSEIPSLVLNAGIFNPGSLFILEHPKKVSFSDHPRFAEQRHYGSVNFTFFGV
ncbi:MAG: RsmD family RNA methyltransferase [Bacteroidales bacterium]